MNNLDNFIDEWLVGEKPKEIEKGFVPSFRRMFHRKDIQKGIEDRIKFDAEEAERISKKAEEFLRSGYYKELIEPHIRQVIKSGLVNLIQNGNVMGESELKIQITRIKEALALLGSIKIRVKEVV